MDRVEYELRIVEDDCTALLALRRRWFPMAEDGFEQRFRAWWDSERRSRHALAAYSGTKPIGMANGQIFTRMPVAGRPPAQWLYVANVFVVEEHRRRGVGRALVHELIRFARGEGMSRVVLAPSEMSIPLYESLGFRPAHDLMRLDL